MNAQARRLKQLSTTDERKQRIVAIMNRYASNLMKTKGYDNALTKMLNNMKFERMEEAGKPFAEFGAKQYSRNTYMGLNQG